MGSRTTIARRSPSRISCGRSRRERTLNRERLRAVLKARGVQPQDECAHVIDRFILRGRRGRAGCDDDRILATGERGNPINGAVDKHMGANAHKSRTTARSADALGGPINS